MKPGLIREEHTSPAWPSKVSICPLKLGRCQTAVRSRPWRGRRARRWASLRRFLTVYSVEQIHNFISCPGGWSQMIPQVKKLDVNVNSVKLCWSRLIVVKLTLHFLATDLVDISAVIMPIARSIKTWDICGIFFVAFYSPQNEVHLSNVHAV